MTTTGGSGGIAVAGTTGVSAGMAGSLGSAAGAAGTGVAGAPSQLPAPGELDPGCGCRIQKAPEKNEAALLFGLLGLVAAGALRRRSARRS